MATTIGELDYKIILDNEQFEKAARLTTKETREMNKTIRETRTPLQRYEHELEKLNNLRRKGAIDAQQYRAALQKVRQEYDRTTKSVRQNIRTQESFGKRLISTKNLLLGAFAAAGIGVAVRRVTSAISDQMEALDELGKTADKLGARIQELQVLRFTAAQTAGMAAEQTDVAIQRIVKNTAKAAQGFEEFEKVFNRLNLDAKELTKQGPQKIIAEIAGAMQAIPTQAERLRLTVALADTEGANLVNTFNAGADAIERMEEKLRSTGQLVDREMVVGVEAANDAVETMQKSWESIAQTLAIVIAPTIERIAQDISGAMGDMEQGLNTLRRTARTIESVYSLFSVKGLLGASNAPGGRNAKVADLFGKALGDNLANVDPEKVLREALAQSGQEAIARSQKKAAELVERNERSRQQIIERQKRIEAQRKKNATEEAKTNKQIEKSVKTSPLFQSFGQGSRGEFEFLRDRQRQRIRDQQRLQAERKAEQQRQEQLGLMREANGKLQGIQDKMKTVQRI